MGRRLAKDRPGKGGSDSAISHTTCLRLSPAAHGILTLLLCVAATIRKSLVKELGKPDRYPAGLGSSPFFFGLLVVGSGARAYT